MGITIAVSLALFHPHRYIFVAAMPVLSFLGRVHPKVRVPDSEVQFTEFTASEMSQLKLKHLPILLEHDASHGTAGKIAESFINPGDGALYVVGQIDDATDLGRQCIADIKSGYRKQLSLGHLVMIRETSSGQHGMPGIAILKQPEEVRSLLRRSSRYYFFSSLRI